MVHQNPPLRLKEKTRGRVTGRPSAAARQTRTRRDVATRGTRNYAPLGIVVA